MAHATETSITRRRLDAARAHFEGSWPESFVGRLKSLDAANWSTVFGATLLLSVVPLLILLSSLANHRIDTDLSRHIGLDAHGARILQGLFRNTPAHAIGPLVGGFVFAVAGCVAVAASLQVLYERAFDQAHRGWANLPRLLAWVAVLLGFLIGESSASAPLRSAAGPIVRGLVGFIALTAFFTWTIHFLLHGRTSWHAVVRPAVLTAIFWLGLAVFSSFYFSSALVSDHKLYGTVGVVFTLLVWFTAIAVVIVMGAAGGAVWQERRSVSSLKRNVETRR